MDLPERRWLETWAFLDRAPPEGLLTELLHRYAEPHRAYHTIAHLLECFDRFDEASGLADRRGEVLLALWFHDAIYDPRASDNEERSARWAREVIAETGGSSEEGRRVEGLILSTKHEALSPAGDSALLVDIDLAILGADAARFAEYESQIRREYEWVPLPIFRQRRAAILRGFLERPRIYTTEPFFARYEAAARGNLRGVVGRTDSQADGPSGGQADRRSGGRADGQSEKADGENGT
jgi:predicted metal-dependent HD superfamily phosphohydrolase